MKDHDFYGRWRFGSRRVYRFSWWRCQRRLEADYWSAGGRCCRWWFHNVDVLAKGRCDNHDCGSCDFYRDEDYYPALVQPTDAELSEASGVLVNTTYRNVVR